MTQTDLSSRLARWALKLQGYKFQIVHRKGKLNVVPDTLSRITDENIASVDGQDGILVDLKFPHLVSKEYVKFRERIETMQAKFPDLKVEDGYVYRRTEHTAGEVLHDVYVWKLWKPKAMKKQVICDSVLCAHGGIHKTIERLRKYYFWPGLVEDVKAFISNCEVCKTSKASNKVLRPPMGKLTESQRFFQRLYIDFLGPYPRSRGGKIGIFIVLDHFSKFVCLKAVKKMSADVMLDYMEKELFYTFGVPQVVFSDNGSQFRSDKLKKIAKSF